MNVADPSDVKAHYFGAGSEKVKDGFGEGGNGVRGGGKIAAALSEAGWGGISAFSNA